MTSATPSKKKLRILLMPFFATSHIGPFTDLAFHIAAARPDDIEANVAVTPANTSIVRSALARRGPSQQATVEVATYPFPTVDGLSLGVENLSTVNAVDAWRIDAAAVDEWLMRPGQEKLIKEHLPDAIITDRHFFWNVDVAGDLGVPCVTFHAIGTFSTLAMNRLVGVADDATGGVVTVPMFPAPDIRIPVTEVPEYLRRNQQTLDGTTRDRISSARKRSLGLAVNTFFDLGHKYCETYVGNGHVKRSYFIGTLLLPLLPSPNKASANDLPCIDWLDGKPTQSVVYLCFDSLTHVSEAQLNELALGLEASGKAFLWVIRTDTWAPPEGWKERIGERGMVVTGWAPQAAVLNHPSVGVFVTHCGWNSILETVSAGVPVLTWPMVCEQFITERFVTEVLGIGKRLWPEVQGCAAQGTRSMS
ncbi:hypothetical protein PR202_ga05573 [Eleusine coracana subsp. coracana]|uniref:Glycosyltransferase n=1 Tax=Eleusine coracana subsp. coracana TaxID=191504 RepID=A0AAV5BSJ7_ELECO|nr:hypothetical protein QOZ80_5AG0367800 [Eleusine coracana subsp. coracana]GJM88983.1 hypothetical protein PR202_ga05119 [Eleusine coracana subsp. coracana]GJM89384.1 hypothetical protein PR202_ga05573 [Eleusine coracana subsp. coracana]